MGGVCRVRRQTRAWSRFPRHRDGIRGRKIRRFRIPAPANDAIFGQRIFLDAFSGHKNRRRTPEPIKPRRRGVARCATPNYFGGSGAGSAGLRMSFTILAANSFGTGMVN